MSDKREFLELAYPFDVAKHAISGWLMSLKCDGHRAFWDGGLTRGMDPEDVPWANTAKDARYIERPKSTGLWSRGGKTIQAPDWWLDALPPVPLDGELWAGKGKFQYTSSVVKQLYPNDDDWKNICFKVFDSPSWWAFTKAGRINTPNFSKTITPDAWEFVKTRLHKEIYPNAWSYDISISELPKSEAPNIWGLLPQEKLPQSRVQAIARVEERLAQCEKDGDEGLMLRHPNMPWEPKRTYNLLKVKKRLDAEAKVVGYIWGRKTDRGSKLLGLMGAIVVETIASEQIRGDLIFELSGFKDDERVLTGGDLKEGSLKAGEQVSASWTNPKFPIGSVISYKYRDVTVDGIPKEAQFDRSHIEL